MSQAKITVNAVPGSNDNVPIATLVQLNNVNIGGETTYLWVILDQPPGPVDSLSATNIQNPTFTPRKEGTYLVKLTVNLGLPDEQNDSVVVAVRQVKTTERIPAAGETTQDDTSDGWATAMNSLLRRIDGLLSDPGIIVGVNTSGGALARGNILRVTSGAVIKPGLPGQETVPGFVKAPASSLGNVDELLCVLESGVDGSNNPANGALVKARYIGRLANITVAGGGVVGDTLYDSDTATISSTPGTTRRQVGSIMSVNGGGLFDVWFDGVGGADITPITAAYVLYGAPASGMVNAKRIDGVNATGGVGGVPYTFVAGDNATVALVARRFAGGQDIFQAQDDAFGVLTRITVDGAVVAAPTATGIAGVTGTGGAVSGAGVAGVGTGTGAGVTGTGGATSGVGVAGTGGSTSGAGVSGTGGAPNGVGVVGVGTGTGNGGTFTGGGTGSGGNGITGNGGGTAGSGVRGIGTGVGAGVTGIGGTTGSSGSNGVTGNGGSGGSGTGGSGVFGLGGGGTLGGAGLSGTGGNPSGAGVVGQGGTTSGPGGQFTGGSTNGEGVKGFGFGAGAGGDFNGGTTSGSGLIAQGGTPNGVGVSGTGAGTGAGVRGTGGATGVGGDFTGGSGAVDGVTGTGGTGGGRGGLFTASSPGNHSGGRGIGAGTGSGVSGLGGGTSGPGLSGVGGATDGHGVTGTAAGNGRGGVFTGSGTNGAPLQLTPQASDPSNQAAGDIYINASSDKASIWNPNTSLWERVNTQSYSTTTAPATTTNPLVETILDQGLYTIPANTLRPGSILRVRATVLFTRASGNFTARIRIGGVAGTALAVSAALAASGTIVMDAHYVLTGSPPNALYGSGWSNDTVNGIFGAATQNGTAITTTASQDVVVTGIFSATNAANSAKLLAVEVQVT